MICRRPRPRSLAAGLAVLVPVIGLMRPALAAGRVPQTDAVIVLPQGLPVRLEAAQFYSDGTLMTATIRNSGFDAARVVLRIVVIDEHRRLRGSARYCVGALLQPGTRQPLQFPLEVKGVVARDRFVAVLEEVRTARRQWTMHGGLAAILDQARRAAELRPAELTADERVLTDRARDAVAIPPCPCTCDEASAVGTDGCRPAALAAFTCSPIYPESCSTGFACQDH
jgi:hypothetical protein